jgi:hypothetical protein
MGGVTGLSAAMVDVLLTGDSEIDPFLMFVVTAEQIEAAWRLYGPQLRAEAKRRGLTVREPDARP